MSTMQVRDEIIFNNDTFLMDYYIELDLENDNIIKCRNNSSEYTYTSMCWRRYSCIWKVIDDKLYLFDIKGQYCILGNEPILASWYSGIIHIPKGEIVYDEYDLMGEYETQIYIEGGQILEIKEVDNRDTDFYKHTKNYPIF